MNTLKNAVAASIVLIGASAHAQVLDTYTGAELFEQFCASCHGVGGKGDGPVAGGLEIAIPDLTYLAADNGGELPTEYLRTVVDGRYVVTAHGTRYMPIWGYEFWIAQGADDEAALLVEVIMANLIGYIESIQDARSELQP